MAGQMNRPAKAGRPPVSNVLTEAAKRVSEQGAKLREAISLLDTGKTREAKSLLVQLEAQTSLGRRDD